MITHRLFLLISPLSKKINPIENKAMAEREKRPNTLSTITDDNISLVLGLYFEAKYTFTTSGAILEGKKLPEKVPKK
jgi:hypothetical protein